MSKYCDASTNTCRFQYTTRWKIFILVPCLILFLFFTLFIMAIVMRRRRQQAFTGYQNRCVVLPSGTPCSYQNSCMVGEMPPPPYPGLICATSSKSYQGWSHQQPLGWKLWQFSKFYYKNYTIYCINFWKYTIWFNHIK
jgi:hypothetical protein